MKKLLLLLMFIPLVSIGQTVNTSVSSYTENELVLSEKQIDIKIPITVDLNNYTHILLVKGVIAQSFPIGIQYRWNKVTLKLLEENLSSSIFEIINPSKYNKKRYRKEGKTYLKTVKDESYLYLYLTESNGKGDDINCSIILRDWKNKIIYSASHVNYSLDEALYPIINL